MHLPSPGSTRGRLVALLVVVLAAAAVPVAAQSPSPSDPLVAPPQLTGTWVAIADAPVAGRAGHRAAWTGSEMLVWGGTTGPRRTDDEVTRRERRGAAYDPVSDTWRVLPRAPIPDLVWHESAWTGSELLVWDRPADRDSGAVGAAYDPATDAWHRLPRSPLPGEGQTAGVWTGAELVVLDGITDSEPRDITHRVAAYDPASASWRRLPDLVASAPWSVGLAWTGTDLFALANPNQGTSTLYRLDGDAWVPIATPLDGLDTDGEMIWTGSLLYVPSQRQGYDPATGAWRAAAAGADACGGPYVWTGTLVLEAGSRLGRATCPAYDPAADRWFLMPAPMGRPREFESAVWADDLLILWSGGDGSDTFLREPDGVAFIPAAAP